MNIKHNYTSPFVILRELNSALGIQHNESLDELCKRRNIFSPLDLKKEIDNTLYFIRENISQEMEIFLQEKIYNFFEWYLFDLVGKTITSYLTKQEVNALILGNVFSTYLVQYTEDFNNTFSSSFIVENMKDNNVFSILDKWVFDNYGCKLVGEQGTLDDDKYKKFHSWSKGKHLPSITSINNIAYENKNIKYLKEYFVFARFVEYIKNKIGIENIHVDIKDLPTINDTVRYARAKKVAELTPNENKIRFSTHIICSFSSDKNDIDDVENFRSNHRCLLDDLREISKKSYRLNEYIVNWMYARYYVSLGNLEEAKSYYKLAFEGALFNAGSETENIIKETFCVIAMLDKLDKVLLKHLKYASVLFGYELPITYSMEKWSSELLECDSSELDRYRSAFFTIFPKRSFYPKVCDKILENYKIPTGIVPLSDEDLDKSINYKNPNAKTKVGSERDVRAMPQLIKYLLGIQYDDKDMKYKPIENIKRLLKNGASVNVSSEVGDTPILLALRSLDITGDVLGPTGDDRAYKLISAYPHDKEIINMRTMKKQLTPLKAAIDTGDFKIVQKIIELGADVNLRFCGDITPLYYVIGRLGSIDYFNKHSMWRKDSVINDESIEQYIREHGINRGVLTKDQALKDIFGYSNYLEYELLKEEFLKATYDHSKEKFLKYADKNEFIKMAKFLINKGADINAEVNMCINGYTPLMLAIEVNNVELIQYILDHNGDLTKICQDHNGKNYSVIDVAEHFKSEDALHLLKSYMTK